MVQIVDICIIYDKCSYHVIAYAGNALLKEKLKGGESFTFFRGNNSHR